MRCPRCSFEGEQINGACARCGYQRIGTSGKLSTSQSARLPSIAGRVDQQSGPLPARSLPLRAVSNRLPAIASSALPVPYVSPRFSRPLSSYPMKAGTILQQGRYRLVDQVTLPENQRSQGEAWQAIDTSANHTQVIIREVIIPVNDPEEKKQVARTLALHLAEPTQHPGLPAVLDVFQEQGHYFMAIQHIDGESLASLLHRQGGALPERSVAEYGRQLCEILTVLSRLQTPLVHGAISPETVIISPDRSQVHLIHLPILPLLENTAPVSIAGYRAPEQARGIVDGSSDLYSVAATMHHAVTGYDPRERIAFFYPPARRLNPAVSVQMENILAQQLRLSPSQRYAHAADMQSDLAALLATPPPRDPDSPIPGIQPAKLESLQMRRESRRQSMNQITLFSGLCLAILLLFLFFSYVSPSLKSSSNNPTPTPNATATTSALVNALDNEWQSEAPIYTSKQIGLSDGRYAFDTYAGRQQLDIQDKKQAAQARLNNNLTNALTLYQQAITSDPTDAESGIYVEDLRIEIQGDPYLTIVLGLPVDNSVGDLDLARPNLLAAYEFQQYVNANGLLPQGEKLRILLANSGMSGPDVATLAGFIAKRVQIGNLEHIVGVVGWPKSSETINAVTILTSVNIPLISQTSSSTALNNISPYFFRVNPNDTAQGESEGTLAYNQLHARNVLVLRDPTDTYSQSLADAFTDSFTRLGGKVINSVADNFTEGTTTVEQYETIVKSIALDNHADLIFMPGFDIDAVRLARAVGVESHIYSYWLAKMKVLGGDGFDTPLLLGIGDGPDAELARNYPQDMQRLIFTSFASTLGWSRKDSGQTTFLDGWHTLYGTPSSSNPTPPQPGSSAILGYDALGVMVYALNQIKGPITGDALDKALVLLGTGSRAAYQGLSGNLNFSSDGNPKDKAVVLLNIVADPQTGDNIVASLG